MAPLFQHAEKISNYKDFQRNDFVSEREFCDFIDVNALVFASDVLEMQYAGHTREYVISEDRRVNQNIKLRVDFNFKSDNGDIYIECKNPTHAVSELSRSISQLLSYSCVADIFGRKVSRLVLVLSKYDPIVAMIIAKYSLPIEVFIVNKSF